MPKDNDSKPNEQHAMLIIGGWKIDAFICADNSLGLTVERCTDSSPVLDSDEPAVDIFVDHALRVTHA